MKKLIYYLLNYSFHSLENKIVNILKKEKRLVVFDVGCYRGIFSRKIVSLIHRIRKNKFVKSTLGGCIIELKDNFIFISKELKIRNINFIFLILIKM